MFKGLGNLASMMKQAGQMQSRMAEVQRSLKDLRVEGQAGGGMIRVEVTGELRVHNVEIDPQLAAAGDSAMLEQLVAGAVNDALEKARAAVAEKMQDVTGGMDLPNMEEMMKNMPGA